MQSNGSRCGGGFCPAAACVLGGLFDGSVTVLLATVAAAQALPRMQRGVASGGALQDDAGAGPLRAGRADPAARSGDEHE
ncbi:hypothetical protein AB0D34_46870 [Streptomyces sp. NPDC048420]|uniref:hypothetical protein n=1 Tax=Streptomyces sp. NPDC048420 TaxID=3155755 RepID=UPI00343BA8FB